MNDEQQSKRRRAAALLTVGLAAAFVFGIFVLASGDWVPGVIIVAASSVGLVQQIVVLRKGPPPQAG